MTQPALSASRLAAEALGLAPLGRPWQGPDGVLTCALESLPILHGDPVMPWLPGPNFMDDADITRSPVVSGYAAAFTVKAVMLRSQRMVFCRAGAFSLATDAARAWFFLTPPEPPFVAVLADSMLQHLIWRSPVNWSQDLFSFRLGGQLLTVRRARLVEAVALLREHAAQPDAKRVFARLDREGKDPAHGRIRSDAPPALRAALVDLTPGELLALASIVKKVPPVPARPQALRLT